MSKNLCRKKKKNSVMLLSPGHPVSDQSAGRGKQSMCTLPVSFLFQGLSTATKDTYDALQMQPLPRR